MAATLAQGETRLTEEILTRTMLHPAKRVSLELDAREGEHQVETILSDSVQQLQVLLRTPGKASDGKGRPSPGGKVAGLPRSAGMAASVPTSTLRPEVTPKPTKARVGQRSPGRDPVGETGGPSVRTAIGCPFNEVIAVTPSQMEEAAVSRVECPECLATREIHPKGETVKFPWHPKRVTRTPHHGVRWVKRESGWILSE